MKVKKEIVDKKLRMNEILQRIKNISDSDIEKLKKIITAKKVNTPTNPSTALSINNYPDSVTKFYEDFYSIFPGIAGEEFIGGDNASKLIGSLITLSDVNKELFEKLTELSLGAQAISLNSNQNYPDSAKYGLIGSNLSLISEVINQLTISQQFINYRSSEGSRLLTLLSIKGKEAHSIAKQQGLYRSTGTNSLYSGTWFPMYGVNENNTQIIVKPSFSNDYNLTEEYPKEFISFIQKNFTEDRLKFKVSKDNKNPCEEMLKRFGNLESMCLSYIIGGGYWNTTDSDVLKICLDTVYAEQLNDLKGRVFNLDSFRQPIVTTIVDITNIDNWLERRNLIDQIHESLKKMQPADCNDKLRYTRKSSNELSYPDLTDGKLSALATNVNDYFTKLTQATRIAAWLSSIISAGLGVAGGMLVGTFVLPVLGTAIGGIIGGAIGLGAHISGIGLYEEVANSEWLGNLLTALGATSTGAAVGALVGSVVPGFGTLVGMGIGAAIGFGVGISAAAAAWYAKKPSLGDDKKIIDNPDNKEPIVVEKSSYPGIRASLGAKNTSFDLLLAEYGYIEQSEEEDKKSNDADDVSQEVVTSNTVDQVGTRGP